MKSASLKVEMSAAVAAVRKEHLTHMLALGVPASALASLGAQLAPFGIAQALSDRSHIYQPGDGPAHVIMPVVEAGQLIDLVAWRSGNPARWCWRTGLGWALGIDWLSPRWEDEPVRKSRKSGGEN